MNTEVSTRNRGPRPAPASRQRRQPAAGQPGTGQPAAPAGEPGAVQTVVRAARGDQAVTRPAGRAAPRLRPPGAGQRPSARPVPASPAPAGPLPGARPAPDGTLASVTAHVPRTRFILLVLGMLGGGLVCLLVINTTLAAASFRISALQQGNVALAQQAQSLQQQVTAEESPASLYKRAFQLGMRQQPRMNFLNLRTGHVYRAPATLPGIPNVPGYAP